MGAGVAVGVELRRLWIRERRAGAGRNCCYHLGGVRGIRTRAGTGWAAGDGETWRLTGERAEQLYRDLSWNSVVLSCTVTSRAAQASTAGNDRNSNSQSRRTPRDFVSLCQRVCVATPLPSPSPSPSACCCQRHGARLLVPHMRPGRWCQGGPGPAGQLSVFRPGRPGTTGGN